jgi:hypothetical protein
MSTFIAKCARAIAQQFPSTDDYQIVLPTQRAKKYFYEALVKAYEKPIYLPAIVTIQEFVREHTTEAIILRTKQLFEFYYAVVHVTESPDLTFEEFLTWAPSALNDYDDINSNHLDKLNVFANLKSIKELESWTLGDDESYSTNQEAFLRLWEELPSYFEEYERQLIEKELTVYSRALKNLSLDVSNKVAQKKHYFFIGFNALTKAELTLIKKLMNSNHGSFWVDMDRFYYDGDNHEAGVFLKKAHRFLEIANPPFLQDTLKHDDLTLQVVACQHASSQVHVAATELSKLSLSELNETLLLLADEALITPLLKNLPLSIGKANITVGITLNQTHVKTFIDLLFEIQFNKSRFNNKKTYYKDLDSLLKHPFITEMLEVNDLEKIARWEQETQKKNWIFQDLSALDFPIKLNDILRICFTDWGSDFLGGLTLLFELTALFLEQRQDALNEQILLTFQNAISTFLNILSEGIPPMNLRTFRGLFQQHWANKSIAFHGNPTEGLQIMGILETRLLDFKNILILGLNEGVLPKHNQVETLIPMDLRRALDLPTTRDYQGLFAHHFYRLFHQAQNSIITYSLASDSLNSSEPSRYLLQLEMELGVINPNLNIVKSFYNAKPLEKGGNTKGQVEKTLELNILLNQYFSKNISASAFKKYLDCPLNFYYRYLAEFGEEASVEEEMESSSLGNIIHKALEKLYLPFTERDAEGKVVSPNPGPIKAQDIENMLNIYPKILEDLFIDFLGGDAGLIASGSNWLSVEIARNLIENLLNNDLEYIRSNQEPVYIHRIEAKLKGETTVELNGKPFSIHWIGYIDRIDRIGNAYRLIDYKSGNVKDEDVRYAPNTKIKEGFSKSKHSLQLAAYLFLFEKEYGFYPVELGIHAIQRKKNAYYPWNSKEIDHSLEAFRNHFIQLNQEIIEELFNPELPFTHQEKSKFCTYCN